MPLPAQDWNQWCTRIHDSNQRKMHMGYPCREGAYLAELCEFLPLACPPTCRCRALGNTGVWVLKAEISFERFTHHFSQLFVKGISRGGWNGRRNGASATTLFDRLEAQWNDWLDGRPFPVAANAIRRTILCDGAHATAAPFIGSIKRYGVATNQLDQIILGTDSNGIYRSKAAALALPDLVIPFDTASSGLQRDCAYDPATYGASMADDLVNFLQHHQRTAMDLRFCDDAREVWHEHPADFAVGTCFSRPIDKQFYG